MRKENFEENRVVLEGVYEFEYLGDVLHNCGRCMRAVMGRVKAAWGSVNWEVFYVEGNWG